MLQNDTILITGGGSGIGEALAVELANENKVIICGRSEGKLKNVSAKNKNISYEVVDISDYTSIEKLFAGLKKKNSVITVLINNAGVVERWELDKTSLSSRVIFDKVSANFSGAVALTQHFINQADKSVVNVIINNTSEVALMPVSILPLYSASKAALSVFTKALRIQLKNTKFKVVELITPGIDTDMPRSLNNTGKLMYSHDFVAGAIKHIRSGKTEYAPGPNILLLKFFRRFAPDFGIRLIDKMSRKQLVK